MKRVDQTELHDPKGLPGNCYAACIASILEVPITDIPQPTAEEHKDWSHLWRRIAKYLDSIGAFLIQWSTTTKCEQCDTDSVPMWPWITCGLLGDESPMPYYIAIGPGPRGTEHCCVYQGNKIVHDPHPSRAGLLDITSVEFIVWTHERLPK